MTQVESQDVPELSDIDLFELVVTEVGEGAAAFAVDLEGGGSSACSTVGASCCSDTELCRG